VKKIYTLAAYITGTFSKTPKVYGTGTSSELVNEFAKYNVEKMIRGNITGMNGIIIGVAKRSKLNGICLLGETSGYVIDAGASKAVLEILSKMMGLNLDMGEMNKKAEDTEKMIKSIELQAAQGALGQPPQVSPQTDEKNLGYIS